MRKAEPAKVSPEELLGWHEPEIILTEEVIEDRFGAPRSLLEQTRGHVTSNRILGHLVENIHWYGERAVTVDDVARGSLRQANNGWRWTPEACHSLVLLQEDGLRVFYLMVCPRGQTTILLKEGRTLKTPSLKEVPPNVAALVLKYEPPHEDLGGEALIPPNHR